METTNRQSKLSSIQTVIDQHIETVTHLQSQIDLVEQEIFSCYQRRKELLSPLTNPQCHGDNGLEGVSTMLNTPKILLVEDSRMLQRINEKIFNKLGHTITIASSGAEAIKLADNESFDIIFMDIGLPDIDGIKTTKAIRKQSKNMATPIVALTANDNSYKALCIDAGMNDFLSKPAPLDVLSEIISKYVEESHDEHIA
ncbi:MAG: hypothetical protein CMF50_06360 [Legionellales bacterium]|nr:hypothetical protein [Legionellales bacterium]|tara:strand:+ start:2226 stop:2822 length:597 start_codon:yes stop_codon:yes gene_type:complete